MVYKRHPRLRQLSHRPNYKEPEESDMVSFIEQPNTSNISGRNNHGCYSHKRDAHEAMLDDIDEQRLRKISKKNGKKIKNGYETESESEEDVSDYDSDSEDFSVSDYETEEEVSVFDSESEEEVSVPETPVQKEKSISLSSIGEKRKRFNDESSGKKYKKKSEYYY